MHMPCLVCGVMEEVRSTDELSSVAACQIDISTNKRSKVAVVKCRSFGEQRIGLKAFGKSSTSSPSTNAPVKCSFCGLVFSKYNLCKHVQNKHPREQVPEEQRVSDTEKHTLKCTDAMHELI